MDFLNRFFVDHEIQLVQKLLRSIPNFSSVTNSPSETIDNYFIFKATFFISDKFQTLLMQQSGAIKHTLKPANASTYSHTHLVSPFPLKFLSRFVLRQFFVEEANLSLCMWFVHCFLCDVPCSTFSSFLRNNFPSRDHLITPNLSNRLSPRITSQSWPLRFLSKGQRTFY